MSLLTTLPLDTNHVDLQRRGCISVGFVTVLSCSTKCVKGIRHGASPKFNLLSYKSFTELYFNIQMKIKSFLCDIELDVPNKTILRCSQIGKLSLRI